MIDFYKNSKVNRVIAQQYFELEDSDLEVLVSRDIYGLTLTTKEYKMCEVNTRNSQGSNVATLYNNIVKKHYGCR